MDAVAAQGGEAAAPPAVSKALDSVMRLLNPHAQQVQEVSMACACAAVHDLASRQCAAMRARTADPSEPPLPSLDADMVLGHASLRLQRADVTWADVSPELQLASDRCVHALLDVLGNCTRAGTAAAGTAALRQVLYLRQLCSGSAPADGSSPVDSDSGDSAFLAVYLPAGTAPLSWAGDSNGRVCTDVFAGSGPALAGAQGAEHAVGLPLAVTAQTFTQWVVDVDEEVDGMTPIQPVGGAMRKNAAGVAAKMTARQTAGSCGSGAVGLAAGDTSYEAAAALLALGHNKVADLLDNGAFVAAQVDALSPSDAVLQLCAVRFLRDIAAHSEAARAHFQSTGLPQRCVEAVQGADGVCQQYAAELLAACT